MDKVHGIHGRSRRVCTTMDTARLQVGDPDMVTIASKMPCKRAIVRTAARMGLGLVAGVAGILVTA